jgi:hypothetical protein
VPTVTATGPIFGHAEGSVEGSARSAFVDLVHSLWGRALHDDGQNIFDIRGGGGALFGSGGSDTFVFDLTAFTPAHRESAMVNHFVDYNQGMRGNFNPVEGDTFVFSGSIGSGQDALLKAILDGKFDGHLATIPDAALSAHVGNWYV